MSTVPLVALKALTYAGRRYGPGDEFHARGKSDARVLIAIGSADFASADDSYGEASAPALAAVPSVMPAPVLAPPPVAAPPDPVPEIAADEPVAQAPQLHTAAIEPEQQGGEAEQPPAPEQRPRRTYRRRDLQSEGGGT